MIREWLQERKTRKLAVKITRLMIVIPLIPIILDYIKATSEVLETSIKDGGA